MTNRNLDAALVLARAGIRVFPTNVDRVPLFAKWQEAATDDIGIISDLWRRAPHALPAIPCGVNGLLVADLDRKPGKPDGVAAFKQLVETYGGLPADVPVVNTPNRGMHCYFSQPADGPLGCSRGQLPPGVDIKGNGGFVTAPGAVLPDGRGWILGRDRPPIKKGGIPSLPVWLLQLLRGNGVERDAERDAPRPTATELTDDARGRAYALAALDEIETELTFTAPGDRNGKLFKASFRLATMMARGWLSENEIVDALVGAAELNGYLREHGVAATKRTINSGLSGGERVPHENLADRHYAPD
jgi:hypothetical protein